MKIIRIIFIISIIYSICFLIFNNILTHLTLDNKIIYRICGIL